MLKLVSELVLETLTLGELVRVLLIWEFAIEIGDIEDPPIFSSFEGYKEAQVNDDISKATKTKSEANTVINIYDNKNTPIPLAPVTQITPIQLI